MTLRRYRLSGRHESGPVTARGEAAELLLTARLNYDRNRSTNSRPFQILTDAMETAAWNTVWHLNHGNTDQAKVFAEAHDLLSRRRRKLLTLRNRAADRAHGGTTLS